MDPQSQVISLSINVLSNFLYDLIKYARGKPPEPLAVAIRETVERFPQIEGLKETLEQWMRAPGVAAILQEHAKGLRGCDPIKVDVISAALVDTTQFYLPEGAVATAHEIVSWFLQRIREQYLVRPELAGLYIANRVEDIHSRLDSLALDLQERLPSALSDAPSTGFDAQIDQAREHIQRHDHDLARNVCEKVRRSDWDRLSSRQRFRVLSNLAAANLLQEKFSDAAKLFIEAKDFQPDDPVALANEALAYLLLNNNDKAFTLASEVKKRFPNSAPAFIVWLNAAPASLQFSVMEEAVPSHLLADAQVATALASRALISNDSTKAESLARRAISDKGEWSTPWAILGESIFRSTLPDSAEDFHLADSICDTRLAEAEVACTRAIELAAKEKQVTLQAKALLVRAKVRYLVGDVSHAEDDVNTAWSLRPDDASAARDYALIKLEHGQKRDAIEKLRAALRISSDPDLRMLLAIALVSTGDASHRTEATQLFLSLVDDPVVERPELRTEAVLRAVDNFAKDERWDEGRAALAKLTPYAFSELAIATLKGRLELAAGDRERSYKLAIEAASAVVEITSRSDLRLLAKLFGDLGRHKDALPLWQQLARSDRLVNDTRALIDCALRLGEHGVFLKLCEELRANGVHDTQLVEAEAGVRAHYDLEGTISLLREHLDRVPNDRNARLQLSVIGLQFGRPELVLSDPASMPAGDETASENWKTVVLVMKNGGHYWEALRFAYRLLRLNFRKIEAHRAYFAALTPTDPQPQIETPVVAGPGTAVQFREESTGRAEWCVIEDEFEPNAGLQEVGPTDFLARQLRGKQVGESFLLAEGTVVAPRATILQILSKYVYRYQDCGGNWLKRFPDQPDVQPVYVIKTGVGGKAEADLTEFFQSFDRIIAHHQDILEVYRSHVVPLHIVATMLGRTEFEQTIRIVVDDSVQVKCCLGNAEERVSSASALRNASAIVLDLTAISALAILESLDVLDHFGTELLVSEYTLAEMQLAADAQPRQGETSLGRDGHRYVLTELGPEAVGSRHRLFESAIEAAKRYCTIAPCPELALMPPEKRHFLVKAVGEHGAQSLILASTPGRILWTDDYAVAVLAMHEFGVRRVWTQVALQDRAEAMAITPDAFIEATAKMLGWRYYFTSASVPALGRAGSLASWNPDMWPLKGAMEVFSDRAIATRDVLQIALSFMLHFSVEAVLSQTRSILTIRILENLVNRGEGLDPISALLRALPLVFGLNVIRAVELAQVVRGWIASRHP